MASKWRRVMAVGCGHGEHGHPLIRKQVLEFRKRYKPEIRFELGDIADTTCFRGGAAGTKDEAASPNDDMQSALRWLRAYEPTHIAWGNHDWRLYDMMDHPEGIIRDYAKQLWGRFTDEAARLKAKTVPYDIEDGWHYLGGRAWGHGYMFNVNALRDHAFMVGCPVVMAHLHTPDRFGKKEGRTIKDRPSFCVGAMADDRKLKYGRRRRNSLTHGHGIVYGEVSETDSRLWLIQSENGKPLVFPPGL